MTPKEKAYDLLNSFYWELDNHYKAKQCALIAVDEILQNLEFLCVSHLGTYENPKILFFKQVKQAIEKL